MTIWKKTAVLLALSAAAVFVYGFGRFLVVNQAPRAADAVIVLSGDDSRLEKAAALRNEGYADYLIVTRTDGRGGIPAKAVLRAGVPPSFLIPEYRARNTYDNAVFSRQLMIGRGFRSALVVSSTYHMRRAKSIFDRVYKGTGIELTYVAAESRRFDPAFWWRSRTSVRYAFSEYAKWAGYMLNIGKIRQGRGM